MWSRQCVILWFLALTFLATQSHVIEKRGLLSTLFGGDSQSTRDVQTDMSPTERSKFRELIKNPIVITMLSAGVGMVVQKALSAKTTNGLCDNKFVKMAQMAGSVHPTIQQGLNVLGCNAANRKHTEDNSEESPRTSTRRGSTRDDVDDDESNTPAKPSKMQKLLDIVRGEKGAKSNFVKGLFGSSSSDQTFKQGSKLPSSAYELDEDDANTMKRFSSQIKDNSR